MILFYISFKTVYLVFLDIFSLFMFSHNKYDYTIYDNTIMIIKISLFTDIAIY